jgi:hypothetical protein
MSISSLFQPNEYQLYLNNLISLGNTDSSLSGEFKRYTFSTQTIGTTPVNVLSNYPVPLNSSIYVEVFANGYDIAGSYVNQSTSIDNYLIRIKNVAGTVSVSGFANVSSDSDPNLGSASITASTSGSTFSIIVNGVVGETIKWSGRVEITY